MRVTKTRLPEATLFPVLIEARNTRSIRWVQGYKITSPDGKELQPFMRRRAAKAFCKAQGWAYFITG